MVFNEWCGELTDSQWRADRRHNISSVDHDGWVALGWDGDAIARRVCTGASVNVGVDGVFGPRRGSCGTVPASTPTRSPRWSRSLRRRPGSRSASVAREPSLIEQSDDMR